MAEQTVEAFEDIQTMMTFENSGKLSKQNYCPLISLPAPMRGPIKTENLKTDLNSTLEHTFEKSFELFLT